ncbi:hypothetical protein AAFF_G00044730 [Aldrovandia affinis]|uniref:Uncharacterized protein n=1 Tax=Aldrovandia affinis TaxID=143900 RepID=A0AAD7S2G5_9TELE|nr:hypothetical protein AAFF_G00044730 [Aldrovandia affinis]
MLSEDIRAVQQLLQTLAHGSSGPVITRCLDGLPVATPDKLSGGKLARRRSLQRERSAHILDTTLEVEDRPRDIKRYNWSY